MNEIGIRIFWGPWDGELDYLPIVSVGNVVGSVVPLPPVLVNEEVSWMIKLDELKAVYSCYSKELCFNSDSYIQLLVCVILPKGQILAGKKSPLVLLEAVRNHFDQLFTSDLEASIPDKEKLDADFYQLLEDYPLAKCPWYVFNMVGSTPATFCLESRSQLDALMRFNAYPALAHVEHLELDFKCKTTVDINTKGENEQIEQPRKTWRHRDFKNKKRGLKKETEKEKPESEENPQIVVESEKPRPKGYQVVVNGQPVKDPTNKEKAKILWESSCEQYIVRSDSTMDYRYAPLTISIDKLRNAPNAMLTSQDGTSKAVLDENSQSIICILNPIPKWYYKDVKYDKHSNDAAEKYCKENLDKKIKIRVDGKEWDDNKIKPSCVAYQKKDGSIELRKNVFSISPDETDNYRFSISKVAFDPSVGDKLCVFIKAEEKGIDNRRGGGKSVGSGRDFKLLLIVAVIGIALGAGSFWLMQTIIHKRGVKQERDKEIAAWGALENINPKNPKQAMSFRDYLRNFSNGENIIAKGDGAKETIYGSFGYPNASHIATAKKKLQTYVSDSIKAERDEEEAFENCKNPITYKNYLRDYNPVKAHRYFDKGKHVDEVIKKQEAADQQRTERNRKEETIKNAADQTALSYLNHKDFRGFRKWLGENNKEWKTEFGVNKRNRELLGRDKINAIEWILDYRHHLLQEGSGHHDIIIEHEIRHYFEKDYPFQNWDEVMKAKEKIDEILKDNNVYH